MEAMTVYYLATINDYDADYLLLKTAVHAPLRYHKLAHDV